jgi:peptidoglycan/LPS O-acetylase OafA/YrhL
MSTLVQNATGTADITAQARPAQDRWLFSIDLLRGLAALLVFLFHAEGMLWRRQGPTDIFQGNAGPFFESQSVTNVVSYLAFGFGFLGVPLFFVISGFCIHLPLAGKSTALDPRSFAIRRFFRLYPLYFIVVVCVMALLRVKYGDGSQVTWPNFLGHLVFWHFNVPAGKPVMGISPVLWSIAVEVQFYVIYALLLPVLRRMGFARATMLFLAIGIAYRIAYSLLHGDGSWPRPMAPSLFAPIRFGEWLLGAWIAEAFVRGKLAASVFRRAGAPIGAVLLAASIATVAATRVDREWLDIPCCLAFAAILAGMLAREQDAGGGGVVARCFRRAARFLGERSYSLYLVHFTVLNVAIEVAARFVHVQDKNTMGGTPAMLAAVLLGVIATLGVTEASYRLVEAPSHRLARRLSRRVATARTESR